MFARRSCVLPRSNRFRHLSSNPPFMARFMFGAESDPYDVERYFKALRRAQMELDLDLDSEKGKHYYSKEIPALHGTGGRSNLRSGSTNRFLALHRGDVRAILSVDAKAGVVPNESNSTVIRRGRTGLTTRKGRQSVRPRLHIGRRAFRTNGAISLIVTLFGGRFNQENVLDFSGEEDASR
jgi:hypothetical protein